MAPEPGLLWTPAYWGWGGNGFVFYNGYWGQQVGFYGGVSYGYGYYGNGYEGGRWQNGQFYYNRSVNNVNVTNIHNVYNTTVINNTTINRVSYNGGNGGISARPTPQQESVAHERHIPPVAAQTQHEQAARTNPEQRAALNHGTPAVAATPKPGAFRDQAVVHAKPTGTPYNAPVNRAAVQPPANTPAAHPENNAARTDRPEPKNPPESNRAPSARPNQPEPTSQNQTSRNRIDRPRPSRTDSPSRIVRRQHSRTIGRSPTGMSPRRDRKLLRRTSVRSLNLSTILLHRNRGRLSNNHSTRNPRPTSRQRRNRRKRIRNRTRSPSNEAPGAKESSIGYELRSSTYLLR